MTFSFSACHHCMLPRFMNQKSSQYLHKLVRYRSLFVHSNHANVNKKMQYNCGVPYSIALSYQLQNKTIFVNRNPIAITLNIILYEFNVSRVGLNGHTINLLPSEYINWEIMSLIIIFVMKQDRYIIVGLKCPSYS